MQEDDICVQQQRGLPQEGFELQSVMLWTSHLVAVFVSGAGLYLQAICHEVAMPVHHCHHGNAAVSVCVSHWCVAS